jgi:hypothetical protein
VSDIDKKEPGYPVALPGGKEMKEPFRAADRGIAIMGWERVFRKLRSYSS